MIWDSNIIIYAAKPENKFLLELLNQQPLLYATSVSKVEVLGYPKIESTDRAFFEWFFDTVEIIQLSMPIVDEAVVIRREKNISLPDSIIAASAKLFNFQLVTRNEKDFRKVTGLSLFNPYNP